MRLGFDATSLAAEGKGVSRFQREFLRAAAVHDLVSDLDVFVPSGVGLAGLPTRDGWRYHEVPVRPMIAWEQVRRPRLGKSLGLDALITTSERAGLWGPPEIVYIYEHPKHRVRRSREVGIGARQAVVDLTTLAEFRLTRMRAAAVVAASRSTARDVGTDLVVYSGVSPEFTPTTRDRTYFLHLASDDPRDNSEVVIDACAAYGADAPPLVIAGPIRELRHRLEARAERLGVKTDWRGFQSGEQLVELYRGAIAYVDPSLYEGFGLQAAEALACGTPVIASNRTSLPEVVGDGGILLDPHDVHGFARAMRQIAEDASLAAELGRRGVLHVSQFTWAECVREILAVCERVLHPASDPALR
jgi:glycosyltransferase involved in cell wall biosynthesis